MSSTEPWWVMSYRLVSVILFLCLFHRIACLAFAAPDVPAAETGHAQHMSGVPGKATFVLGQVAAGVDAPCARA